MAVPGDGPLGEKREGLPQGFPALCCSGLHPSGPAGRPWEALGTGVYWVNLPGLTYK